MIRAGIGFALRSRNAPIVIGTMSPQVLAAVIAGLVVLLGYPVTSFFASRRAARAKEMAFKLECYQEFLKSFFELANRPTYETQLSFTHSVNVLNLMAGREILDALHDLRANYEKGTEEQQWRILDEILYRMRRDMLGSGDTIPHGYNFPVLVTDPEFAGGKKQAQMRRPRPE